MSDWDGALTVLLAERGTALKRYAFLLCGDDSMAEDLVQEALIRALSRPFLSRDPPAVEAYTRKIIANLAMDRHRRLGRWRRVAPIVAVGSDAPDHSARVATEVDLAVVIERLPPRQRVCVVLRFYDDLSVPQIAECLGCSQGAVKRYLSEAMGRLRTSLESQEGASRVHRSSSDPETP